MATDPAPDRGQMPDRNQMEEYADGEIHVRHGSVNTWLLIVYAALAVWGVYYLFRYWTGP